MNKERLLEKSRAQNIDEGNEYVELIGIKKGFCYMNIIYCAIGILESIMAFKRDGKMISFYAATSMYFCFTASIAYQKYVFEGKKGKKYVWFFPAMGAILFFINFAVRLLWP